VPAGAAATDMGCGVEAPQEATEGAAAARVGGGDATAPGAAAGGVGGVEDVIKVTAGMSSERRRGNGDRKPLPAACVVVHTEAERRPLLRPCCCGLRGVLQPMKVAYLVYYGWGS